MGKVVLWVILGIIVFLGVVGVMMGISYSNQEVSLRNQAAAQQKANEVIYDKVWKVLQQKAQVADKYASDFKSIYANIMNERYAGDQKQAPLFKWITEHNPQFSIELYTSLSDAIESNRAEFARVQNRLVDIKREHDNLRQQIPSKWFVGSRPELVIQIVTSGKTKETFKTGEENDVDLFNKK